jgi:23S rRNA pseudouridine1911/1915/1917 synthase
MINEIIYEDNHIIIVNKLPGDLVQADVKEGKTLRDDVKTYIKEKYQKPGGVFLGVVHRLILLGLHCKFRENYKRLVGFE